MLKKSQVLKEGYEQGLRDAIRIIESRLLKENTQEENTQEEIVCELLQGVEEEIVAPFELDTPEAVLSAAAMNNNLKLVKKILEGNLAAVDCKDDEGYTPLMWAALNNNHEMCTLLLAAGADVNERNEDGQTPLMYAWNAEICKTLLEAGAEVDSRNNDGWTPLMVAALNGSVKTCGVLLDAGADINAKNSGGRTPLIVAAYRGQTKVCRFLLKSGADASIRDNDGFDALEWATQNRHPKTAELLGSAAGA